MTRIVLLVIFICSALAPFPTIAQVFDRTVLSFSFADDDVMRDSGETRRNSPMAYFGGQATSPADRFGSSIYSSPGSRLVISKKFEYGNLIPEGALRLRAAPNSDGFYSFQDDSTWLGLTYLASPETKLKLTLYPLDADRFRAGYNWDISWGGTNTFPKNFRKGLAPGLKLDFDTGPASLFVGMKTALIRSPSERILNNPGGNTNQFVEQAYYGFLSGTEIRLPAGFAFRASGGFFEKGTNTSANVLGRPIYSGGAGAQLAWHYGMEVGRRLDLRLYFADPDHYTMKTPVEGDWGADVAFEGTWLIQTLEDTDNAGSTKNESSKAFALSMGMRRHTTRLFLDVVYRDLTYIVFNVPGFEPYKALPESANLLHSGPLAFVPKFLSGELFGLVSIDHFFQLPASLGLTPALSVGILLPATYMPGDKGLTIEGPYGEEHAQGRQRVVVRGSQTDDWDILPPGEVELPVFLSRVDLKFSIGENFSFIGEVSYINDANYSQVELDDRGHARRRFIAPHILAFGLVSELSF